MTWCTLTRCSWCSSFASSKGNALLSIFWGEFAFIVPPHFTKLRHSLSLAGFGNLSPRLSTDLVQKDKATSGSVVVSVTKIRRTRDSALGEVWCHSGRTKWCEAHGELALEKMEIRNLKSCILFPYFYWYRSANKTSMCLLPAQHMQLTEWVGGK